MYTLEDFGDYQADYAAEAVAKGFGEVEEVTERTEQGFAFFGGDGPSSRKVRTARVLVTKPGFVPNPNFPDKEVEVGSVGYCPAEWVEK